MTVNFSSPPENTLCFWGGDSSGFGKLFKTAENSHLWKKETKWRKIFGDINEKITSVRYREAKKGNTHIFLEESLQKQHSSSEWQNIITTIINHVWYLQGVKIHCLYDVQCPFSWGLYKALWVAGFKAPKPEKMPPVFLCGKCGPRRPVNHLGLSANSCLPFLELLPWFIPWNYSHSIHIFRF